MKTITLTVSSRTGNTKLIANAAREAFVQCGYSVEVAELDGFMHKDHLTGEVAVSPLQESLLAVCFWCDRSSLDTASKLYLLEHAKGARVVALGTFGGYPESPYGDRVRNNVRAFIEEAGAECLGVFLSQGKVRMDNIEKRRKLPEGNPHRLDDAGVARVLESQNHPNQQDADDAKSFCRELVGKVQ